MTDHSDGIPKSMSASLQELKEAATQLNAVSDMLGAPISALDAALKRLNLGIQAWAEFDGYVDADTGEYWRQEVGYARVDGKWGIALRSRHGDAAYPDREDCEEWLFNDAPRALRVKVIDHLPKLIEALIKEARHTANTIMEKIGQAEQFAEAMTGARLQTAPSPSRRK